MPGGEDRIDDGAGASPWLWRASTWLSWRLGEEEK
jgi:hypothetical protein